MELSRNLRPGDPTVKQGQEVTLTIAITNMSRTEIFGVPTAKEIENDSRFSFLVVSPSGKHLYPHGDPMHVRAQSIYSLDAAKLSQRIFTFPLSAICKLDEIGTYSVTAYRVVDWPDGKKEYVTVTDDDGTKRQTGLEARFTVISNPLSINIVPDK